MDDKQLVEALCIFNRIESLMRKNGAKGESFSDLVKSYNIGEKDPKLKACREFTKKVGHMFYFNRDTQEYYLKDNYDYEEDTIRRLYQKNFNEKSFNVESDYSECKDVIRGFYSQKDRALDGFYSNLKIIGHERNQLLHIYNYKIVNFKKFKKACNEIINYFEKNKKPFFGKTILENNEQETINYFWLKFIIFIPFVSAFIFYLDICSDCNNLLRYPLIFFTTLVAAQFLFKLLSKILLLIAFIFENTQLLFIVIFIIIFTNSYNTKKAVKEEAPYNFRESSECNYQYVKTAALNVRASHSSRAKKIDLLDKGDKVCITEEKAGWSYAKDIGWVASKYLSTHKNESMKE